MIDCRNVTKRYEQVTAVDNVSLQVSSGICALLGPNGADKSTLLRILASLLPPDSGEVHIAGIDVLKYPLPARQIMGVMPDDLGLFDSLTVQEHLELNGPIYGLSLLETRQRAASLLRLLGLEDSRETFLDQCSHGMRKKTALALALLHNPRVLFLDEPFEGIDPVASRTIRELLTAIAQRGVTVFFTSHSLAIVAGLGGRTMLLRGGRIVWDSAMQTATHPLEEVYFEFFDASPSEDLAWLRSSPS